MDGVDKRLHGCVHLSEWVCIWVKVCRGSVTKYGVYCVSNTHFTPPPSSEEIMQRLLDNMFSSESPSDVVIVHGIAVILTILEKRYMYGCLSKRYGGGGREGEEGGRERSMNVCP